MTSQEDSMDSTETPSEPRPAEPVAALEALIDAGGLIFADAVAAFARRQSDEDQYFIQLARDQWVKDGEIEIDDDTIAGGSDDHGDYVLAWVWVDDPRDEDGHENDESVGESGDPAIGIQPDDARGSIADDVRRHGHQARPDDDPEPGDRCKECGQSVTWLGPNFTDWLHTAPPADRT
jgi:hypothetical protein